MPDINIPIPDKVFYGILFFLLASITGGGTGYLAIVKAEDRFTGSQGAALKADVAKNTESINGLKDRHQQEMAELITAFTGQMSGIKAEISETNEKIATLIEAQKWLERYSKVGESHIGTRVYPNQAKLRDH